MQKLLSRCAHFLALSTAVWAQSSAMIPVTAHNARAQKAFDEGMQLRENLRNDEALVKWREAVKADPQFATAWAYIAYQTKDAAEEKHARTEAKLYSAKVPAGEKLFIKWITARQEGNAVGAISAMNDLLDQFPDDKRFRFFAGTWLISQGNDQYEQGAHVLQQALDVDPDYAAALNEIGYAYAYNLQFDKAYAAMDRYSRLLPNEPNPEDSYAEILRMGGKYEDAIAHYRKALQILPSFVSSQLGLGDTYAMMGNETQAREEYAKAIAAAPSKREKLQYEAQSAITYVREGKFSEATAALERLHREAHLAGLVDEEADIHRMMALYESDPAKALSLLSKAERELEHTSDVSRADRAAELAVVLRDRARIAAQHGMSAQAEQAVARLEQMAKANKDFGIQSAYHGARGALLLAQKQYADAAGELNDDAFNPYSQRLLVEANSKSGDKASADAAQKRMENTRQPQIEDALAPNHS